MTRHTDYGRLILPVLAGILVLMLIIGCFTCGCLDTEPEEMPVVTVTTPVNTAVSLTETVVVTQNMMENTSIQKNSSSISAPISLTTPGSAVLYTERDFPQEVKRAIGEFIQGNSSDSINSFLRWDSVRSRAGEAEAEHIREQIHGIDYAMANTTTQENLRLYYWVSGEQAKRILNDSVFSDNGYLIASSDPTVLYHTLWNTGRDKDGYLSLCVMDFRKGDHLLYVNASDREFLVPRGSSWVVTGTETDGQLSYTADSIPKYDEITQIDVRLIYLSQRM